jgi:hypothetical protein
LVLRTVRRLIVARVDGLTSEMFWRVTFQRDRTLE